MNDDAVRDWMQRFAALTSSPLRLPDPALLWLRGEMIRRWDAQRVAMRPIEIGDRIQIAVGVGCATVLLAWLWIQ